MRCLIISRSILAALLLLPSVLVVTEAQSLVWSDEFEYTGAPDKSVWTHDVGNWGWGNNEYQDYTANSENSFVENGKLHLRALRGDGLTFTSARLKTEGKLYIKYGVIETRIKIPDVHRGLWPAFWTLGQNFKQVGWPASGEFDILEAAYNNQILSAVHHASDASGNRGFGYGYINLDFSMNQNFHVYKLEWTPDFLRTTIDDVVIFEYDIATCKDYCPELHQPHFLLVNLAVGGDFTLQPDDPTSPERITAPFPATMEVDYVRVYTNAFTELSGSVITGEAAPTDVPVKSPTDAPVKSATNMPTEKPIQFITVAPANSAATSAPMSSPDVAVTASPTTGPKELTSPPRPPTTLPSTVPPVTQQPVTQQPSPLPTNSPTTSQPTVVPTNRPTSTPFSSPPTASPTSLRPSLKPGTAQTDSPTGSDPISAPTGGVFGPGAAASSPETSGSLRPPLIFSVTAAMMAFVITIIYENIAPL